MRSPKSVHDLLDAKDSALASLVRSSQQQCRLNEHFNTLVDTPIADHVQVGSAENGILTLVADTSVWGHRIRYLAPTLLEQLRTINPSLIEVKIIVRPLRTQPDSPTIDVDRETLSSSSASLLNEIADTCNNPDLARILKRLSKQSQSNN